MKKISGLIFASLTAFIPFSAANAADKVVVSYLAAVSTLPLFVAIETKMFEKAGLDVESVKFENPNQIIDSLISGRADSAPLSGAAGITVVAESRFPGVLRVIGLQGSSESTKTNFDTLIVRSDSTIKSFADLKGKKIAHVPGIQWKTITRFILKANKLDPDKDVEMVEMAIGLHAQAVASGTVDAALTLEPTGAIVSASGNLKTLIHNPAGQYIVDPFYAGAGIISTKFITDRPEVAKRFLKVIDDAIAIVNKNFKANSKYLIGYTPVTEQTLQYVTAPYILSASSITGRDIDAYQKFADLFVSEGAIRKKVDVKHLILSPPEIDKLAGRK